MAENRIETVHGDAARQHLADVAALRIAVFRSWPYLYEGDLEYEHEYLSTYVASPRGVFVLAFDGERVIGASTGVPLADDAPAFQQPFDAQGIDVGGVFYFGESVLLPAYRGRGIGHAFFDAREAHARALGGFEMTTFAAVNRDAGDPRRPAGHRDNDVFWTKRGYSKQAGLTMQWDWNEVERGECAHALTFWTRPLEPSR